MAYNNKIKALLLDMLEQAPQLEAHIHCLSFEISDEINRLKGKPTQTDLVVMCEEKKIMEKIK
ncbi:MAG: hypothetical protein K2M23_01700 [Alphaproteobacteria bacterium]|nr:hypothetical protein [Alphaproteobacteria bacterium]